MRLLSCVLVLILFGCEEAQVPKPRPHQYPRVQLPTHDYQRLYPTQCPFQLELPSSSAFNNKESRWAEEGEHQCWFDIAWADLGATLHCSYFPINKVYSLDSLVNDAFELASKHNSMASFRDEIAVKNSAGHDGLIFEINGPVASPYQFYLTDEESHFVRGSLYFDTKVDLDSIQPVLDYLKYDVEHIIASLQFEE